MVKIKRYELRNSGKSWEVYEKSTDQVLSVEKDRKEASRIMKFLDGGGAFNGFTPSFLLVEVANIL